MIFSRLDSWNNSESPKLLLLDFTLTCSSFFWFVRMKNVQILLILSEEFKIWVDSPAELKQLFTKGSRIFMQFALIWFWWLKNFHFFFKSWCESRTWLKNMWEQAMCVLHTSDRTQSNLLKITSHLIINRKWVVKSHNGCFSWTVHQFFRDRMHFDLCGFKNNSWSSKF